MLKDPYKTPCLGPRVAYGDDSYEPKQPQPIRTAYESTSYEPKQPICTTIQENSTSHLIERIQKSHISLKEELHQLFEMIEVILTPTECVGKKDDGQGVNKPKQSQLNYALLDIEFIIHTLCDEVNSVKRRINL